LSEGFQLYFGRPEDALYWFGTGLGFAYQLERDGAVSDWLMDLVSVGFQKPEGFTCRSMCTVEDVVMAYHAFQVPPSVPFSTHGPNAYYRRSTILSLYCLKMDAQMLSTVVTHYCPLIV
jgi:hypothetical protein